MGLSDPVKYIIPLELPLSNQCLKQRNYAGIDLATALVTGPDKDMVRRECVRKISAQFFR